MKFYIVSGGIKGVVTESFYILQMQHEINVASSLVYCMTPEIYNTESLLIGFEEPTIITTNKHECMTHKAYTEIKEGTNAIVMGDLIEDYWIVKNLKMKNVIGIGFFNIYAGYKPEQLANYMDVYDIVIANDGNLDHAVQIVRTIIGQGVDPEYVKQGPSAKKFAELFDKL